MSNLSIVHVYNLFKCYWIQEHSLASIYLFKVNSRNTKKRCEICLKLTIKTEERQWRFSGFFTFLWIRGASYVDFRTQCVIIMQEHDPPPYPPAFCVISTFSIKLIVFQKILLNVFRIKKDKLHLWRTV